MPLTLDHTDARSPSEALEACDENTICIVPIAGVTWTGLDDDIEGLDKALDAYNAKTGYEIPIHVDAASGGFILPFLQPREEVGLPPQMGAVDLHVGPQVRTGVPRTGMGRMEGQEVPARRNVVLGQLPRRQHHAGGPRTSRGRRRRFSASTTTSSGWDSRGTRRCSRTRWTSPNTATSRSARCRASGTTPRRSSTRCSSG